MNTRMYLKILILLPFFWCACTYTRITQSNDSKEHVQADTTGTPPKISELIIAMQDVTHEFAPRAHILVKYFPSELKVAVGIMYEQTLEAEQFDTFDSTYVELKPKWQKTYRNSALTLFQEFAKACLFKEKRIWYTEVMFITESPELLKKLFKEESPKMVIAYKARVSAQVLKNSAVTGKEIASCWQAEYYQGGLYHLDD